MKALILLMALSQPVLAGSISILGPLAHDLELPPGHTRHGVIVVRNDCAKTVELVVYQSDFRFFADGRNIYDGPGTHERSNAGWITYAPDQFALKPGEKQTVAYRVSVPPDPSLRGTYWSLLMVEPVNPRFQAQPACEGLHVASSIRYGIQISTTMGSHGSRDLSFEQLEAAWGSDAVTLHLELENTGEVKLSPVVWVEIFDPEGGSLGRFDGGSKRIYPACSAAFDISLPGLTAGRYTALVVADNGDEHVFGSQLALEIQ
ncbi:MAG: hypothetical protein GF355_05070 [Candidatus Eisenbacteria bacterium]|nr:hypothetical protein [Candidatus Eisenbacteria bacterium]